MEEIQVGEYVRTKEGEIAKIVDTNMFDKTIYKDGQGAKYYLEDIAKHSFNLINLIKVGDYVNGISVVGNYEGVFESGIELANHYKINFLDSKTKIKTIVTKEQFASLEYKVEVK